MDLGVLILDLGVLILGVWILEFDFGGLDLGVLILDSGSWILGVWICFCFYDPPNYQRNSFPRFVCLHSCGAALVLTPHELWLRRTRC